VNIALCLCIECIGSVVKWDILSFGDTEAVQCLYCFLLASPMCELVECL